MAGSDDHRRSAPAPSSANPTALEVKQAIDSGRRGDKVSFLDPAAPPLGTDDEAAGQPDTSDRVATALHEELNVLPGKDEPKIVQTEVDWSGFAPRPRPLSPNIQIYRPQLTSVLSITNRITGVVLSLGAVGLVAWLVAVASGPQAYAAVQGPMSSWIGRIVLFGFTFVFFLHFCGGIRHLVWDTVRAFELRSIYLGGWTVIAASVMLTVLAWTASIFMAGQ